MLVMIVHAAIRISEIDDRSLALILLSVLFLWDFVFNFGPVFKI
jgi:hypothetical protein